jgi:[ribosomal protein S5]-alanine N-acetyltransferase
VAKVLRLRPGQIDDLDGLYALATIPLVYRYLFDGEPPSREYIAKRLAQRVSDSAVGCFGLWFLQDGPHHYAGCVELRPYDTQRTAEITWLLHPDIWGRGLALRMAWSVIEAAFESGQTDAVIAGADLPNLASLALMRRLGMRIHQNVTYPLGIGAEYILHRGDAGPLPRPELISVDVDQTVRDR